MNTRFVERLERAIAPATSTDRLRTPKRRRDADERRVFETDSLMTSSDFQTRAAW
jgi:hypothetical protein